MGVDRQSPYIPLPDGLNDPRQEAGRVFDRVAALYDAVRPGYPAQAFVDLAARCQLDHRSRVLEIGCGTGQATRDLARVAGEIDCLEPGPSLAAIARKNLASAARVRVIVSTFEAAPGAPFSYDAIVSATAFHWVDPSRSFAKAARLLREGGTLALLTNVHASGGTQQEIAGAIGDVQRELAPEVGPWSFPPVKDIRAQAEAGGDIAAVWSRVERKLGEAPSVSHLFEPPAVSVYPWLAHYTRTQYLSMLASQSTYALMDATRRQRLLDAIGQLVDERLDGTVTKQYVTILATALRRRRR